MVSAVNMIEAQSREDFAGLLEAGGFTPAQFADMWGLTKQQVESNISQKGKVPKIYIIAALYSLANEPELPTDNLARVRDRGIRLVAARRYNRQREAMAHNRSEREMNAMAMTERRARRTKGLTREQRSARRAGYDID